jgi:hypothetical protein
MKSGGKRFGFRRTARFRFPGRPDLFSECNRCGFGVEGLPVVIKPFDKWTTQDMMDKATKCCKFVLEPPRSLFGEFDSIQVYPSTKLLKFLTTKLR